MKARFTGLTWENAAHTIATISLQPDHPYFFTAGQYADVTVAHDSTDNRGTTRTMTLSSSPSEKAVRFTTCLSEKNSSTYKRALLNLAPGNQVTITDAMGDMVLPLNESVPLVFVAGGVGIASYVSMVRWLAEQDDRRDITLLYTVRNTGDIIFQETFDAYRSVGNLRTVLYTTDNKVASADWNGQVEMSRLTSTDIASCLQPSSQVYLSGTESMVEQFRKELERDFGVAQYRIVYDYFEGYTDL
ncbi:MAG TPA: FAD-dependent oxidoreductase [Candidatus Saccharimonadales bacterium]|nr:FAD-dependent oxidoreductase [Candidatus Saccharimonadales bacterium]